MNTASDDARRVARISRWLRVASILVFAWWVAHYIRNTEPLLHGSLLIFHEAGHVLFMPFGEFTMVLGGSLFELMLPAFIVTYFVVKRDAFAACFSSLYLAAAFGDVGRYIADARAGDLPLISGDRSSHDWTFLLIEMKQLDNDIAIGGIVSGLGWMIFWGALALGVYAALRSETVTAENSAAEPVGGPAARVTAGPWKED
jgi:hypothetical protein